MKIVIKYYILYQFKIIITTTEPVFFKYFFPKFYAIDDSRKLDRIRIAPDQEKAEAY